MGSKLTDADPMPYGKYKGRPMEDVPADYLMWLIDNNRASPEVKDYIKDNIDVLMKEINESKNQGR